jgi:hypothetical protein
VVPATMAGKSDDGNAGGRRDRPLPTPHKPPESLRVSLGEKKTPQLIARVRELSTKVHHVVIATTFLAANRRSQPHRSPTRSLCRLGLP